jgi:hypothetical protein
MTPHPASPAVPGPVPSPALDLVLEAAWPGWSTRGAEGGLADALALARANQVEGALARRHPKLLADELYRVERTTRAFNANLAMATDLLRRHGIEPVLVKCVPEADHVYGNFDLVVGPALGAAVAALSDWGVRTSGHRLERSKVLVHPASGPAAHLHREASWWDVPVVDGERLRARARDSGAWLVPAEVDQLRVWLAHAVFQNLAIDLAELLALRPLLRPDLLAEAAHECGAEGWEQPFRRAAQVAAAAVDALDRGVPVPLPVRLPLADCLAIGGHARHLARTGRLPAAVREIALRGPLVLAKTRRVRRSRAAR